MSLFYNKGRDPYASSCFALLGYAAVGNYAAIPVGNGTASQPFFPTGIAVRRKLLPFPTGELGGKSRSRSWQGKMWWKFSYT